MNWSYYELAMTPLIAVGMFVVLWIWYIAVTHIMEHWDELEGWLPKTLAFLTVAGFVPFDWFFNLTVGSFMFGERPQSWKELFTNRLKRWESQDNYRGAVARWLCKNLLNPFDHDGHC